MRSLEEMQKAIADFCTERDWDQFHNAKDLAIGISTEANELLDLFRFKSSEEALKAHPDKVREEVADIFFFLLRFAERNQIDLDAALQDKMEKNNRKYPVEKARGSNKKYNEYE
ncbi:MAG: nucleotide pyrophosphohydrolase [Erysipelotrichaceae bacterium]|nr:nucleotide pyrophosphohydrolase [Erysipelotrichaceae bacterium]